MRMSHFLFVLYLFIKSNCYRSFLIVEKVLSVQARCNVVFMYQYSCTTEHLSHFYRNFHTITKTRKYTIYRRHWLPLATLSYSFSSHSNESIFAEISPYIINCVAFYENFSFFQYRSIV